MSGWIVLRRSLTEHWLWTSKEPFDKRSAWVDLLFLATHTDNKELYKGNLVTRKRGEVSCSMLWLAERWRWDRKKVKQFLSLLQSDGMISINSTTQGTTIIVENYDRLQTVGTTEDTTIGTTTTTTTTTTTPHTKRIIKNEKRMNKGIYTTEFEELWEEYPKKQGKKTALEKYIASRKEGYTFEQIKNGLLAYVDYLKAKNTEDRYIKQGSTFFSQRAWLDEWKVDNGYSRSSGEHKESFEEMLARL